MEMPQIPQGGAAPGSGRSGEHGAGHGYINADRPGRHERIPSYEVPVKKVSIDPGFVEYVAPSDAPSPEFVEVRFFARESAVAAGVDRIRSLAEDGVVLQRPAYRAPGSALIFDSSGDWRQV
jgi:hypothetical protein